MKTMKLFFAIAMLVVGTTVMAQTENKATMAFNQTSELVASLNLSDAQTLDILAINQKYADLEAFNTSKPAASKWSANRANRKLTSAKTKEIKSVLDKSQKAKYESMIASNKTMAPQYSPEVAFDSASQSLFLDTRAHSTIVR